MQTRIIRRTKTNQENARNEFDYLGCHESVSVPEPGLPPPSCCGPASSFVSYMKRNRVSGFPGGFPPPFQASLLCTARNSANDLCTPNIHGRLFDPKQLIGALWIWNIRYPDFPRFEGGLFRKWLESSQGREKEIAGRILDCFARLYYRWSFLPFEISPYCDINTGCPRNHGTKKINREKNDSFFVLSESRNKWKIK